MRNQKVLSPHSWKFCSRLGWNSVCCHNLLVCGSSHYNLFFSFFLKWYSRERTVLMWYCSIMFSILLFRDTCWPICFKLHMMLNKTKLYCLIPVWLALMLLTLRLFWNQFKANNSKMDVESLWDKQIKIYPCVSLSCFVLCFRLLYVIVLTLNV